MAGTGKRKQSDEPRPPLRYRRPLLSFIPTVAIFGLFTYYCLVGVVDPSDPSQLLPSSEVREVLAARAAATADDASRQFHAGVLLYYITNGFYRFGLQLLGSLAVQQTVCAAAWLAHVGETVYAWSICRSRNASFSVTIRYLLGVFLGGITQLLVLKKEQSRI